MKKIIAITLSLVMLFVSCAMAQDNTKLIEIGTSGLEFYAPDTYEAAEITAEDTDENQVAYYASEAFPVVKAASIHTGQLTQQ